MCGSGLACVCDRDLITECSEHLDGEQPNREYRLILVPDAGVVPRQTRVYKDPIPPLAGGNDSAHHIPCQENLRCPGNIDPSREKAGQTRFPLLNCDHDALNRQVHHEPVPDPGRPLFLSLAHCAGRQVHSAGSLSSFALPDGHGLRNPELGLPVAHVDAALLRER